MKIKLIINNVDRTNILIEDSWSINNFDGDIIDIAEFELDDQNANITITEGQDLILEDDSDNTVRFFAGIIVDVRDEPLALGKLIHITASDWKMIVDRAYFTLQFDDLTDKVIIQNAFTEANVTEIDTSTSVQSARTIDKMVFRGASLRQMLDAITDITGWFWDVDKFKKLIYRPYGDATVSFSFTENADEVTKFPYYNISRSKEIGQFNEIEVHGSSRLSAITNQTYSGNGTRKRFTLSQDNTISTDDYPVVIRGSEGSDPDIPSIDRNTGTVGTPVWTSQTVGIEEQDTGKDVVWNPAVAQVLWTVAPPNFASNSWRVTGRGFVRAGFTAKNEAAIAIAGRVFKKVLTLPEIEDDDQAVDVANAFLREQGAKTFLQLTFQKDSVKVGDSVAITNTPLGLTALVLQVHQLTMRQLGGEVFEYTAVMRNAP
jgi:hypothetical protein